MEKSKMQTTSLTHTPDLRDFVGGFIILNTILLIFFTAIVGIYYAKLEGLNTIKSGMINMYQNKIPF